MKHIYMDYAATTPVHPEVLAVMQPYFTEVFGNASSIHWFGNEAKKALDKSRSIIAAFIGAAPEEIIFTAGGTESDNFALKGVAEAFRATRNHIITSRIEHHAVLESCHFLEKQGFSVTYLPVDSYGRVDPGEVKKAITPHTCLVSVMQASNEVGTLQPISEIGRITREAGVLLHCDAVQSFGHIPVNVDELNVDLLSVSGHKLYGPKGTGFLYVRQGTRIAAFIHGGGQEDGRRGGTYNIPGIVGLGKAVEIAGREMTEEAGRLSVYRDRIIAALTGSLDMVKLNGHPVQRLPNNINVSIAYVEGEATLMSLDLAGIAASTGSACSSESSEPSHVLSAMCVPAEEARCSMRFTLGKWNSEEDVDYLIKILPEIVTKLRAMSPLNGRKIKA